MYQKDNGEFIWMLIAVTLSIGMATGYLFGYSRASQRAALAENQAAAQMVADDILVGDPSSDMIENPFEEEYENPFEGDANPF